MAAGVVVDMVAPGMVGRNSDLLGFVLEPRCVDFCMEGLQIWQHLKVTFCALQAVRPAQCRCDQEPHVSHCSQSPLALVGCCPSRALLVARGAVACKGAGRCGSREG